VFFCPLIETNATNPTFSTVSHIELDLER